jgi:prevent-host-death family protein
MRSIQASEAKTRLLQLLTDVEKGESVVITRHGRPIARLVPESEQRADVAAVMRDIEALRQEIAAGNAGKPKFTLEEILSARHEGHKY